jgi:hypothetical protein
MVHPYFPGDDRLVGLAPRSSATSVDGIATNLLPEYQKERGQFPLL